MLLISYYKKKKTQKVVISIHRQSDKQGWQPGTQKHKISDSTLSKWSNKIELTEKAVKRNTNTLELTINVLIYLSLLMISQTLLP